VDYIDLFIRHKSSNNVEKNSKSDNMAHSKNLLTKKISEKSQIQGVVVSSRRVYVYSDETDFEIKLENLLISLLSEHGPLTRSQLVSMTHIPRSTLYDNLAKLITKGVLKKESVPRSTRGRPKVLFKLA
jgi:predicted transcriptional regulator